jgi:UDP-N-acetylmuramoylalanine--D-glutamate ligase
MSGLSAARLARSRGMTVTIYDEQATPEAMELGFGVASGSWDPVSARGRPVIASPGSERSPGWGRPGERIPIWSDIEFAYRHIESPIAAVTGTNGKTTVTEATATMLDASGLDAPATGNIGAPLSDFADESYDALVVEVSSFQLRFTEEFHPQAAAITNVAVDHLDWHGSAESYRDAKARIFANQTSTDLLVYDCDDEGASRLAAGAVAGAVLRCPEPEFPRVWRL